jgi:hypothetical protein
LALLLSTYPRWDLTHLVYISPVFYVLAAWLLADTLRPAARLAAFGLVAFYSVVFSFQAVWERRSLTPLSTGIGVLRGSKEDIAAVRSLTQSIPPGRTVFSFPYLVMMGFLVQGRNPTSFPYLQPGLMDAADESAALAQLSRTPPEWIVYADVPPEAILRMWPSSDPARLRFPRIEAWIAACYERTLAIPNPGVELQVLRPRGGKIPPSCREPAAR